MPNGETHAKAASQVAASLTVLGGYQVLYGDPFAQVVAAGIVIGSWGGFFCSPDLDIAGHYTEDEQRIWRFNHSLGRLWSAYWYPYGRLHGHHGHGSHWLVLGTIVRYAMLWWPLLWLTWYLYDHGMVIHDQLYFHSESFRVTAIVFWFCVFIGQTIQDAVHICMDAVYHEGKAVGRRLHLR